MKLFCPKVRAFQYNFHNCFLVEVITASRGGLMMWKNNKWVQIPFSLEFYILSDNGPFLFKHSPRGQTLSMLEYGSLQEIWVTHLPFPYGHDTRYVQTQGKILIYHPKYPLIMINEHDGTIMHIFYIQVKNHVVVGDILCTYTMSTEGPFVRQWKSISLVAPFDKKELFLPNDPCITLGFSRHGLSYIVSSKDKLSCFWTTTNILRWEKAYPFDDIHIMIESTNQYVLIHHSSFIHVIEVTNGTLVGSIQGYFQPKFTMSQDRSFLYTIDKDSQLVQVDVFPHIKRALRSLVSHPLPFFLQRCLTSRLYHF